MRHYELTVVLDPTLGEEGVGRQIERIKAVIAGQGGQVLKEDRWGMRSLAYRLSKQTQGFYVVFELEGPAVLVAEVDRVLRLDEMVLRHLVIHYDAKTLALREEQLMRRAAGQDETGRVRRSDEDDDESRRRSRRSRDDDEGDDDDEKEVD
jgi:small subunit ribosomal protein S6